MPENANDKAAFPLPAIQQTGNRTKNVRKMFTYFSYIYCNDFTRFCDRKILIYLALFFFYFPWFQSIIYRVSHWKKYKVIFSAEDICFYLC